MPIPEEERFESYLKEFRPVAPPRLPVEPPALPWRHWVLFAAPAAAAILLLAVAFSLHTRPDGSAKAIPGGQVPAERLQVGAPLTLGSANSRLASGPSVRTVLDEMSFPSTATPPKGKASALAVLSKEKIRL
ncbi:MAG TPA: hypothetical protein VLC12_03865 [Terriglobales bacterium]|nr:hypothetical protein [Terriglobales bacterium]